MQNVIDDNPSIFASKYYNKSMITFFILLIIGISCISLLTIGGAVASRKFNFDFSLLSLFSLVFYFSLSLFGAKLIDATAGVTLAGLMGLFEAVIGWKWIAKFDANFGEESEEIKEMIKEHYNPHPAMVLGIVLTYMFLGWLGTLLA